ncbi:MAG: MarR family transcriptional regulator [Promethearchaeota archaeon]|nr:MAG: MarR family transcriptional regulator [Candidatus Lokiarchaeota archaeon]
MTFNNNHIFKGRIREFENELVSISLEIGKRRGQTPIITKILLYLYIHNRLTQKQLKELTGYSIGTISTHLNAMLSMNFIDKKLIPGTHKYTYSLKIDIGYDRPSLVEMSLDYINQAKKFLKKKRIELNEIPQLKADKFRPILKRFDELEQVIEIYVELFRVLSNPNEKINIKITPSESESLGFISDLDPNMKLIENDIIEFFTHTPMFFGKQEIFSSIFVYFITRKTLTQKKIRKLTGLSAGKVSQEINKFLELGVIEIMDKAESGQLTYQMSSIASSFMEISHNVLSEYIKWKKKVEEIHEEMLEKKEDLINQNGFDEILKLVNLFLNIMPIYEKIYEKVKQIRKSIQNE